MHHHQCSISPPPMCLLSHYYGFVSVPVSLVFNIHCRHLFPLSYVSIPIVPHLFSNIIIPFLVFLIRFPAYFIMSSCNTVIILLMLFCVHCPVPLQIYLSQHAYVIVSTILCHHVCLHFPLPVKSSPLYHTLATIAIYHDSVAISILLHLSHHLYHSVPSLLKSYMFIIH